jgi:hypothetical protein
MHVVRHHNERIGYHIGVVVWNRTPDRFRHQSRIRHHAHIILDFPENTFAVMHAHGHEIRARSRIVMCWVSRGSAVVFESVVRDGVVLLCLQGNGEG